MVVAQYEALRSAVLGDACLPKPVPGCCSFSTVACADGRGPWPPCVHRSGQLALGHRTGRYRKSTEAVVHILAAMVIKANHYGATP